ncbi:DNA alkylation repair enzyme [Legionella quinlivanii]|uniref:DNA alkylation repair enzyme n=1 Tax=Legionella quinlivanii TaxID=45073 RepID=A0A0W0Y3M4_9GAMM|nr:DNA alkylation repair protein [Legionella quinlivanii]KTD51633.1 DNA alkylation repair enzyme [Legionella quinlivanii]MCW8450971.1 DNA alkylation repair protein [Legionella quinlivanii]SEF61390.1 3-methyladenine DNA glycosylase AlkD [Legionella quinlivanii DSM 21216]STY10840.1 DNA alkylation repair enzyme [Legionella quinlivanii]
MRVAFEMLQKEAQQNANPEAAQKMAAYMLNQFSFIGLAAPLRRHLAQIFFKTSINQPLDELFKIVDELWSLPQREFQYIAIDLMQKNIKRLSLDYLPVLFDLAIQKSWWDSVDGLASVCNKILKQTEQTAYIESLKSAICSENLWIRRIALLHQLGWKEKTDTHLLFSFALQNAKDDNFFIQKAIGWSLRDYAKYNPEAVYHFIDENKSRLAKLSYREASKHRK